MEIDQEIKLPVKLNNDPFNFDDDFNKENVDENGNRIEEQKKKKPRVPRIKLDHNYLIDNPLGMKNLYKTMVIDKDKNLQFRGAGHEHSDFKKLMNVYKNWHFEAMPKLEFSFFAERLIKAGNDKAMRVYMSKLRQIYKGDLMTDEFADLYKQAEKPTDSKSINDKPNPEGDKPMFEYINTSTTNNKSQPKRDLYGNIIDEYEEEKPFFKLMDPANTFSNQQQSNAQFNLPVTQIKQQNELTQEQLRMIEENRRIAMEKKRKREEAMQNSNESNHHYDEQMQDSYANNYQNSNNMDQSTMDNRPAKKQQTEQNSHYNIQAKSQNQTQIEGQGSIANQVNDDIGFQMIFNQTQEEDMIDIDNGELADCLDDIDNIIDSQLENGQFDRKLDEDDDGHFEYN
ncbi:timeless-interacting protein [Stylonychia lemnae]|uniref:Timeless-interacting protein n=1 Tax=Stylonychia lemnae TaxID=5949 RepID=A0A078B0H2_STYLE|nr:timeless-interacting protein [Stylonychia lemnae]|eukprot:CDW88024.1 timeless-interacting protein [Stylonychia lemnae]